ncbi:signal peptidase I [Puteibacter caeruleilacunae]|nr:signal peptidase I [Puteibacter caeruleilacunae]
MLNSRLVKKYLNLNRLNVKHNRKNIPFIILVTITVVSGILFLRNYTLYSISSGSMENTILIGDKVLVHSSCDYVSRGSIAVFHHDNNKNKSYIKRCVGLPSDTFIIRNGAILCNNKIVEFPGQIKKRYKIWINNIHNFRSVLKQEQIRESNLDFLKKEDNTFVRLSLTKSTLSILQKSSSIDSIKYLKDELDPSSIYLYPHNKLFQWTIHNFGPVVIPHKGMTIKLNPYNYALYKHTILNYEGHNIEHKNQLFFIDNEAIDRYTFKKDYYFFMGDNRNISYDSRSLGFIPFDNIEGTASIILYNTAEFKYDLHRICRSLN